MVATRIFFNFFHPDPWKDDPILAGGNSNICYLHPDPWGNDPIWWLHIFQMSWWKTTNHKWEDVLYGLFTLPGGSKCFFSSYFTQLAVLTSLLKTNMAPENHGKSSSQPSFFRGYVVFRECSQLQSKRPLCWWVFLLTFWRVLVIKPLRTWTECSS